MHHHAYLDWDDLTVPDGMLEELKLYYWSLYTEKEKMKMSLCQRALALRRKAIDEFINLLTIEQETWIQAERQKDKKKMKKRNQQRKSLNTQ
jgi:hypothetical protein